MKPESLPIASPIGLRLSVYCDSIKHTSSCSSDRKHWERTRLIETTRSCDWPPCVPPSFHAEQKSDGQMWLNGCRGKESRWPPDPPRSRGPTFVKSSDCLGLYWPPATLGSVLSLLLNDLYNGVCVFVCVCVCVCVCFRRRTGLNGRSLSHNSKFNLYKKESRAPTVKSSTMNETLQSCRLCLCQCCTRTHRKDQSQQPTSWYFLRLHGGGNHNSRCPQSAAIIQKGKLQDSGLQLDTNCC